MDISAVYNKREDDCTQSGPHLIACVLLPTTIKLLRNSLYLWFHNSFLCPVIEYTPLPINDGRVIVIRRIAATKQFIGNEVFLALSSIEECFHFCAFLSTNST